MEKSKASGPAWVSFGRELKHHIQFKLKVDIMMDGCVHPSCHHSHVMRIFRRQDTQAPTQPP